MKVYRVESGDWVEMPGRRDGRRYSMTSHPETLEVCEREFSDADEIRQDAKDEAYREKKRNPPPRVPSQEERFAALEEEVRALKAQKAEGVDRHGPT